MPIIAANGILILIPSALYLASKGRAGEFDSAFYAVQTLELAAGAAEYHATRAQHARRPQNERLAPLQVGMTFGGSRRGTSQFTRYLCCFLGALCGDVIARDIVTRCGQHGNLRRLVRLPVIRRSRPSFMRVALRHFPRWQFGLLPALGAAVVEKFLPYPPARGALKSLQIFRR
jgi:hypothetical protein